MKILMLTPDWGHPWMKIYPKLFEAKGHTVDIKEKPERGYDLVLHMWSVTFPIPGSINIFFMRRYELFERIWMKFNWDNVDCMIFVNDWIKFQVDSWLKQSKIETETRLIYNAIDLGKWTYKRREHGKRIGMSCRVNYKKNLPLALQVLKALPEGYKLHIAGDVQDGSLMAYMSNLAVSMGIKVHFYGFVEDMDGWWDHMDYCLSTSFTEGNPNNVLEAMAKGIMPVVHNWPGAKAQFSTFDTADEAAEIITRGDYSSEKYRGIVESKHNMANLNEVVELAENLYKRRLS